MNNNEELSIQEVNGELYESELASYPDMCYGPVYVAECGEIHKIWHGCGATRYACYIDCLGGSSFLSTLE